MEEGTQVAREPPILMFHEILTEGEMAYMRNNAMADLEAATVQVNNTSAQKLFSCCTLVLKPF